MIVARDVADDTADRRFAGREGVVRALVFDCPEEQYPHDPMILVEVPDLGEDLFFAEELELQAWARQRIAALRRAQRVTSERAI